MNKEINKPQGKKVLEWNSIKWALVEGRIERIQKRIYAASKLAQKGRVLFLQEVLINSLDAKLIAVRRVTTENKGRKTPGVDGVVLTTPKQRAWLVSRLTVDGSAAPIRRVWIPKPGRQDH
jgi:RNA-directed DNA polymerase